MHHKLPNIDLSYEDDGFDELDISATLHDAAHCVDFLPPLTPIHSLQATPATPSDNEAHNLAGIEISEAQAPLTTVQLEADLEASETNAAKAQPALAQEVLPNQQPIQISAELYFKIQREPLQSFNLTGVRHIHFNPLDQTYWVHVNDESQYLQYKRRFERVGRYPQPRTSQNTQIGAANGLATTTEVERFAFHTQRAMPIPHTSFFKLQTLSATDLAQNGIGKIGQLPDDSYGIIISDLNKYAAFKQRLFQPKPALREESKLPKNKVESKKREAGSLKMFAAKKRKSEPKTVKVKFTIDEKQRMLISVYEKISAGNNQYCLLSPTQVAWLEGKKVNYLNQDYQITDADFTLLVDMLVEFQRTALFNQLWKSNPQFSQYIFEMKGEKLYPVFCHLIKTPANKKVFMAIWPKLLPWLKANKKLPEIFILNSTNNPPVFAEMLLEQFSEIKDWFDHCEDLNVLSNLLPRLVYFQNNAFKKLMGKESPLTKLFLSFPEDKKFQTLFEFATSTKITLDKISLIMDLCSLPLLEKLLQRVINNKEITIPFIISTVEAAVSARKQCIRIKV